MEYYVGLAKIDPSKNIYYNNIKIFLTRCDMENDSWSINQGGNACYSREGYWEYSPLPSNRDESFLTRCRYTLKEAKVIAKELVK